MSMMQEDHEFANHLEDGSLVQSVTVLSKDCSVEDTLVVISYP